MFSTEALSNIPSSHQLFATGADGTEDLGQEIVMRNDEPSLPYKYWVQLNGDDGGNDDDEDEEILDSKQNDEMIQIHQSNKEKENLSMNGPD